MGTGKGPQHVVMAAWMKQYEDLGKGMTMGREWKQDSLLDAGRSTDLYAMLQ